MGCLRNQCLYVALQNVDVYLLENKIIDALKKQPQIVLRQ